LQSDLVGVREAIVAQRRPSTEKERLDAIRGVVREVIEGAQSVGVLGIVEGAIGVVQRARDARARPLRDRLNHRCLEPA
jgi:hypothetical protein